ncbi:hypothetical protein G3O08_09015 [Cryomorpha ignava]|uniref:Uncharacterized protein n=1 Tax=Cryomorpha ignava TaxID=101383 RepID=A0A7K3WRH1_9FLAO|nr:hypothetical protein [Cryomorpha ignava]NEN23641.1 hypothetical protein [Cryomorpha ignava]
MNPKKVFFTFGFILAFFIVACCISLASAKSADRTSEAEQSRSATHHYELPKLIPAAWLVGR